MFNFVDSYELQSINMNDLTITVKTLFGFEDILKEEVAALGFENIEKLNRAVQLKGTWEDVYTLNFKLRLAIAVLVELKSFRIKDEKDLYEKSKSINWTDYFDVDKTFAVKGAVFSTLFTHTAYPYLVVKDAIADTFREKYDKRPDVNLKAPQVLFDVYIKEKAVTISLNTSGQPLFMRGYRQETGEAPMNEVLAAGLLKLSGWDQKSTLIDPMCGSGTLVMEAALLAADIPSMIERQHYAFKNFKTYDEAAWLAIYDNANRRPKKIDFSIIASDHDAEVLQKAKRNSRYAPIGNMVQYELKAFADLEKTAEKGTLICNPPYGERMGSDIEELYSELGDFFKQKMTGFDCWVVSSNMEAIKFIGLKPDKKIKVFNGSLECSFRKFSIFEGTKKTKYEKPTQTEEVSDEQVEKAAVTENKDKRDEPTTRTTSPKPERPIKARTSTDKTMDENVADKKEEVQPKATSKYTNPRPSKYIPTVRSSKEKEDEPKKEQQNELEKESKKETDAITDNEKEERIDVPKTKDKLNALKKYRTRSDD